MQVEQVVDGDAKKTRARKFKPFATVVSHGAGLVDF